jgi:hypothetical protein
MRAKVYREFPISTSKRPSGACFEVFLRAKTSLELVAGSW